MEGEVNIMVHRFKMGSLYLDDEPVNPGIEYQPGQTISLGEAISDKEISWVPANGLLIADRCLLTCISWDDLNDQGLVFGREIELHGFKFRARLLKVGSEEGIPNEWDAALDTVGDSDDLWHWGGMFFWGQEEIKIASGRAYRGYSSARYWNWNYSSNRNAYLGFRPALEPLPTDPSALRHGQEVLVIGHDGAVVGDLEDMTPYDFIIRSKSGKLAGKATFAANMRNGTVAVDRSGVLSIATTQL